MGKVRSLPSGAGVAQMFRRVTFRFFALVMSRDSGVVRIIRRPMWNFFYSNASRRTPDKDLGFMNLGYLESPGEIADDDTVNIDELVSTQLYERVVEDVDLEGRSVVEVGCGHGAGSAHLARTHHPRSLLGVDINTDLIAWCAEHQQAANLQFLQGDAQELPIADGTVDVLVNVESSHCYPSRSRFFDEVVRVLRPGGSFAFADVFILSRKGETPAGVSDRLRAAGLEITYCLDITSNVLAARDAVWRSPAFQARMQELAPRMVPIVQGALFLPGAISHSWMASGRIQYWQWRAVKPALLRPSEDHASA